MYREKQMNNVLSNKYKFQLDIIKKMTETNKKKVVLGAAPRAGKTRTTIKYLIEEIKRNPNKKHFIFAEGKNFLKTQWCDALIGSGINFAAANGACDFGKTEWWKGDLVKFTPHAYTVYVVLPHMMNNGKYIEQILNRLDLGNLIVDEAHNWSFATTYKKIKNLNWDKEIYLSGTPFKFNKDEKKNPGTYEMIYTPGLDLIKKNIYSDVKISQTDYCGDLTATLKKTVNKKTKKTLIFATSIEEADVIGIILNGLNIKTLVSHSENDQCSENIRIFKAKKGVKVLVCVSRATLGFDMPELNTLIDFKGSLNPTVILQSLARVFTQGEQEVKKEYIRVVDATKSERDAEAFGFTLNLLRPEAFKTWEENLSVKGEGRAAIALAGEDRLRRMRTVTTMLGLSTLSEETFKAGFNLLDFVSGW